MIIRFCLLWCFFGRGRPTPKYSYKNSPLLSFPELCGLVTPWKIHTNEPQNSSRVQGFKSSVSIFQFCPFFSHFSGVHIFPGGLDFFQAVHEFRGKLLAGWVAVTPRSRLGTKLPITRSWRSEPGETGCGWVRFETSFFGLGNFLEPKKITTAETLEQ